MVINWLDHDPAWPALGRPWSSGTDPVNFGQVGGK